MSEEEFGVEGDFVHFSNRIVVSFVRDGGFDDEFTHVKVIIVVGKEQAFINDLLMIGGVVEWGAEGDLEGAGQAGEHQVFDLVNGLVKHGLGFPVVADHDGEVRMKTVLGEPAEAFFSELVLVAFVEES